MARQQLELIWQSLMMQSRENGLSNLSFPIQQLSGLDNDGLSELLTRFSGPATVHIYGQTVYLTSATTNVTHLGQQQLPDATSATSQVPLTTATPAPARRQSVGIIKKSQPRAKGKAKIPRPPNAFILYRQEHHPKLKSQFPGMHNNEISVRLGNQWKSETEEIKELFKAKAAEVKREHLQNHPGYQYQPRRPSEKKRRMTKGKTPAASQASAQQNITDPTAFHTPATSVTMSDQSSTPAETPSWPLSAADMARFLAQLGAEAQLATDPADLLELGGFAESPSGMTTYDLSMHPDDELIGDALAELNSNRVPNPDPGASQFQSVSPTEDSNDERTQARELLAASPVVQFAQHTSTNLLNSEVTATGFNTADTTSLAGALPAETWFNYDCLELDRNDSMLLQDYFSDNLCSDDALFYDNGMIK